MNGLEQNNRSVFKQILTFRTLHLGDTLNAIPTFRALRAACPNARIARLVISNDIGMSHVAAALKRPSVILFALSNDPWWARVNEHLHKRIWQSIDQSTHQMIPEGVKHLMKIYSTRSENADLCSLEGGMS